MAVIERRWDWVALRAGAGVALMISLPVTVVAAIVDGTGALFFFGALLGFVMGSGCAAWVQRAGTPLSHALVTASGTYLAMQGVLIAIRLARGEDVDWYGAVLTLMFVAVAGVVGGILGDRLRRKGFVASVDRARS